MTSQGHIAFLPVTLDRTEIETWNKCQCVCLIEADYMICNTYLGHL